MRRHFSGIGIAVVVLWPLWWWCGGGGRRLRRFTETERIPFPPPAPEVESVGSVRACQSSEHATCQFVWRSGFLHTHLHRLSDGHGRSRETVTHRLLDIPTSCRLSRSFNRGPLARHEGVADGEHCRYSSCVQYFVDKVLQTRSSRFLRYCMVGSSRPPPVRISTAILNVL